MGTSGTFGALIRWETAQLWRGVGLRVLLPVALALSVVASWLGPIQVYDIDIPRNTISVLWSVFLPGSLVLGLLILIVTSEYVLRDRRDHIEETLATLPIVTPAYGLAKYLVALGVALLLSMVFLVAQMGVQVIGYLLQTPDYPTLALEPDVRLWAILLVPVAFFASAIGFLGTILLGTRRLILFLLFFALWLAPYFISNSALNFADITASHYNNNSALPHYESITHNFLTKSIELTGHIPPGQPGASPPGSYSASLAPVRTQLIVALNSWPPDLWRLVQSQLIYCGVALILVALAILLFRRYQPGGEQA